MKKIICILLSALSCFALGACAADGNGNGETPVNDAGFFESFYTPSNIKEENVSKASYAYNQTTQGADGWYYYYKDASGYLPMAYENEKWTGGGAEIDKNLLVSSSEASAVRGYKVPADGKYTVCGRIAATAEAGCTFSIYLNDGQIWPVSGTAKVEKGDLNGLYYSVDSTLKTGDMLYFSVDGSADCNPSVRSENYEETLYQVPDWNFYGDVHPFYYNGKMYMYNLQAYLENPGNERYMWCLHTSTDMFNYKEEDYYLPSFLQNHYCATLGVYESVFDKQTFPYGSRDMFMFFDEGAQRYIYFGLCYYKDMSSCLGMRVSDDDTGTRWSTPMRSIRDFDYANDPECSQALYINDRWYLFTSVWGRSIHSVGRPSYFIGDKGKNFLENDWSAKEEHFLDGEDLCAANFADIGDGHYMMYGWIPKTTYDNRGNVYFDGTRDHGLWGGNINMAREIYQRPDGTLGARLDPQMTRLLSRGALLDDKAPALNRPLGDFGRSFVTFDVDIPQGAKCVSYNMKSGDKEYYVSIENRADGAYMSISCPQDTGHPEASSLKIGDSVYGKHSVKLIIDRSIAEFFVDDAYSLTARTSLFGGEYAAYLSAEGNVSVTNLVINKLACCGDVYD